MSRLSWQDRLATESGFAAMARSSRDIWVLGLQALARMYGFGASYLILVDFLVGKGFTDVQVGVFMTLTVLGDAVISLILTTITDRLGRRRVLAAGAGLMAASGLVFASTNIHWVLVLASVLGVISPSGKTIGPFRTVEESILAQLTPKGDRSDIFAWYTMFGTAGAALGTVTTGWLVQILHKKASWSSDAAYRAVFGVYAALGLLKLFLCFLLTPAVEVEATGMEVPQDEETELEDVEGLLSGQSDDDSSSPRDSADETRSRRKRRTATNPAPPPPKNLLGRLWALVPSVSSASRYILFRLLILFALDSFASGVASPSWLTYFFTTAHHLEPSALGSLFFIANLLSTISNLLALPLARRLGPLKTMVFTHLPSAIFLAFIGVPPVSPKGTWVAMAFLALRACTSSMDQAPRQAFLAAAVLPAERTAVLGVVNIVKTIATAGGLGTAGAFSDMGLWTLMFAGAGILKAGYDLMMLYMFVGLKDREIGT